MESKINYATVGLFVVIMAISLIIIAFWLSASLTTKEYETYMVIMRESVSGLNVNAPVKFNGVPVGMVSDISINKQNPQEVILLLSIEEDTPITTETTATLITQGITGIGFIGLNGGRPGAPPLKKLPYEPYPIISTQPSLFLRLDIALSQLTSSLTTVSDGLKQLLTEENQRAIRESLENISKITKTFADNSKELDMSLKNAAKTFQYTGKASQELTDQTLPSMSDTLLQINHLSNQLLNLSRDLDQNPSMLIRGRSQQAPGPGE